MTTHRPTEIAKSLDRAVGQVEAILSRFNMAQQTLVLAEAVALHLSSAPEHQRDMLLGRHVKLVDAIIRKAEAAEESRLEQE